MTLPDELRGLGGTICNRAAAELERLQRVSNVSSAEVIAAVEPMAASYAEVLETRVKELQSKLDRVRELCLNYDEVDIFTLAVKVLAVLDKEQSDG